MEYKIQFWRLGEASALSISIKKGFAAFLGLKDEKN